MIAQAAFTVFALGLRHGADPDHLAAIDNMTRNATQRAPSLSRFVGSLFATGHTIMVLAMAALVGYLGAHFAQHSQLVERAGTALSIVMLLLIAGLNIRQLALGHTDRIAGVKTRLIPAALRSAASPWAAVPVGFLFGFGFETSSQVAAYALAFGADAGVAGALLVGAMFCAGMLCTDTLDSLFIHHLVTYRAGLLPRAMRAWIWCVTTFALAVAGYELAQLLGWNSPVSDLVLSAVLAGGLLAVFAGIFLSMHGRRLLERVPVWGGRFALTLLALGAIAVWPFIGAQRVRAAGPYVAPVLPDYQYRDSSIAFYEERVGRDPADQISAKLLAAQYMQRYRETQDVGDVSRAIAQAQRSLKLQPQNNSAAAQVAAAGYTALHQFRKALRLERVARTQLPSDSNAPAQMASIEMELGDYARAAHDLSRARQINDTPTVMAIQARYDELTGHLARARRLLEAASQQVDQVSDNSAQGRAWYHFRAGELAFASGDVQAARSQERIALSQFPNFAQAYRALARFCWAAKDWRCALDTAAKGANIIPEPETLGYEADAQRALGDAARAEQTQQLIFAIERIGNAYHINDRLLAVYYAQHGLRAADAYRIALREVRTRGNEIYAQDTLAWCAAMAGKWRVALAAARQATRYGTEDPRIQYHAGMIALHFGLVVEARTRLRAALTLNPQFDPIYADVARRTLAAIR